MFKPYSKNKSLGIPEGENMTAKEYKEALKARGRNNKYNAKKATYNGYNYDSKLEAAYARELDLRKELGEVEKWERQVPLDLRLNGKTWRTYKIDFKVYYPDGKIEYVEVKGFPTTEWKQKWDFLVMTKEQVLEPGALLTLQYKNSKKTY